MWRGGCTGTLTVSYGQVWLLQQGKTPRYIRSVSLYWFALKLGRYPLNPVCYT